MASLRSSVERNFYLFAVFTLIIAWIWLIWSWNTATGVSICPFRQMTGLPCPSCGTTTAVQLLAGGHWQAAALKNPLSYVVGPGLIVLPLWIVVDMLAGRKSLRAAFFNFDDLVKSKRRIFLLVMLLVLANWIWNFVKM